RDYLDDRLPADYVWISPYVHSSPTAHYFSPGPVVYWSDIVSIDPPAHFFNLFACSNCRYITPNNMGGTYTFVNTHGLAAVGSCKTGSMLQFEYFYEPLGEGGCLGEGYRDWWDRIAENGFTTDEIGWHLGMVLLGDPTIIPAMHMLGVEDGEWSQTPPVGALAAGPNPCPAGGEVLLQWTGMTSAEVRVFDLAGRLVVSSRLEQGDLVLSTAGWSSGVYLVRAAAPAGAASESLMLTVLD
ncbi:T9SS type A sorting domain-containing protein, partial [Candidatus Fermentibacterales bacterium]|nr:T9SS type A sorting domain-containing protein [Candidatus Fermentibacterales bacterium]